MALERYRLVSFLSLAVLLVSLSACTQRVSSLNPIGPLSSAAEAPELVGTWVLAADQPHMCGVGLTRAQLYLHIYPESAAGSHKIGMLANVFSDDPSMENAWMSAEGYVTRLKNGAFINLRLVDIGPAINYAENKQTFDWLKGKYLFAVYKTEHTAAATSLTVGFLAQSNFVKPPAHPTVWFSNLADTGPQNFLLTDSSAHLAAYIATLDDAALFGESCVLHKAK